jgi:hypothetical protein
MVQGEEGARKGQARPEAQSEVCRSTCGPAMKPRKHASFQRVARLLQQALASATYTLVG